MKVLVIGQCQGGNAEIWKDFINHELDRSSVSLMHYMCRNACSRGFEVKTDFAATFRPFGIKTGHKLFNRVNTILGSRLWFWIWIRLLKWVYNYDIVHIQGNYEPSFNLKILKIFSQKGKVLNIYGSDFYQNYKKGSDTHRSLFERAIINSDHILFNFEAIQDDFVKDIEVSYKSSVGCFGIAGKWSHGPAKKKPSPVRLLSARGLYAYNNVHKLVAAFKKAYANNEKYQLDIVNGYGWDEDIKSRVIEMSAGISNINLFIGEWISEERLKQFYENAHYNFCIGETDQMTASIPYGYLNGCINILTPIESYKELDEAGFSSHIFLRSSELTSIEALISNPPTIEKQRLLQNFELASDYFLMKNRFQNTINVYKSLVSK